MTSRAQLPTSSGFEEFYGEISARNKEFSLLSASIDALVFLFVFFFLPCGAV
jgi:hypothetical protein